MRAGKGGPVPAHLRGSGYAGAARLGHGKGYVYAHDEPDAVAAQQYLPDDLAGSTDYYRPTDRGLRGAAAGAVDLAQGQRWARWPEPVPWPGRANRRERPASLTVGSRA